MNRQQVVGIVVLLPLIATGCSASRGAQTSAHGDGSSGGPGALVSARDRSRLEALEADRVRSAGEQGYRVGPDDLLDVRIPDLLDQPGAGRLAPQAGGLGVLPVTATPTFQQGVRVDAHGDVSLPLIGTVGAAGRTPVELEQEIARRLVSGGILLRPRVSVLVAEHRSHVVAVVGSVERPGLYPLTRPEATLADMIWAAGGPTKEAGRMVAFVPAGMADPGGAGTVPDLGRLEGGEAIHLDLETLLHATASRGGAANPRVQPGDVVSVAPAGTVQVDGWVGKPGSYPITRSLTLTGAVAAAGGRLFPADTGNVTVTRAARSGGEQHFTVDLDSVSAGRAEDVVVTDGDVVSVPVSIPKIVPYGLWTLVTALVHVGGTIPLF